MSRTGSSTAAADRASASKETSAVVRVDSEVNIQVGSCLLLAELRSGRNRVQPAIASHAPIAGAHCGFTSVACPHAVQDF